MILSTKGIAHLINEPLVGRVTRNRDRRENDYFLIYEYPEEMTSLDSFQAILTCLPNLDQTKFHGRAIYAVSSLEHLFEDDIVVVHPNGIVKTLFRISSFQNFILFTERCNSNCIMCSQPPKNRDDSDYLFKIHSKFIPLIPKNCSELGITGGEPTLLGNKFFQLLEIIKKELPNTEVHCLTNGRSFAWNNLVNHLHALDFQRLMLGIPLYSDFSSSHDYIVQAKGAFNQTMLGLYNLALIDQRIEIRIVLHKQTIPRLVKLSRFIYKNIPFAEQVVFMGLENQGYTPHNINDLWIDPVDYMEELVEAVEYLSTMGMNVSIYNSQLCLLPESLWRYNRNAISDWKNIYLEECNACYMRVKCGGLFNSSVYQHSQHIKAFAFK